MHPHTYYNLNMYVSVQDRAKMVLDDIIPIMYMISIYIYI